MSMTLVFLPIFHDKIFSMLFHDCGNPDNCVIKAGRNGSKYSNRSTKHNIKLQSLILTIKPIVAAMNDIFYIKFCIN